MDVIPNISGLWKGFENDIYYISIDQETQFISIVNLTTGYSIKSGIRLSLQNLLTPCRLKRVQIQLQNNQAWIYAGSVRSEVLKAVYNFDVKNTNEIAGRVE